MDCETCMYFEYDELTGDGICNAQLDEDEFYRLSQHKKCPYYRDGDDYALVRKQN